MAARILSQSVLDSCDDVGVTAVAERGVCCPDDVMNKVRDKKIKSGISLHQQLTDRILDEIREGRIKLGSKLPSQSELMEQYGVSVTTVRQLMANLERCGVIRRERGRGNFVSLQSRKPNEVATMRTLGVIFEHYTAPENISAQNALILAFREACRKRGIHLLYMELRSTEAGPDLIETFKHSQIDGLCMCLHEPDRHREVTESLQREFPSAVTLVPGSLQHGLSTDLVDVDIGMGVRQLMKYMLSLGHRRIAYVGSAIKQCLAGDPYITGGRWQIYESELRQAGVEIDPSLTVEIPHGERPTADTAKQILDLVRRPDPVTAIFAQNDWMAGCVMKVLWHNNIHVPKDVSLAGFDNIDLSGEMVPALTTVGFPFERMAEVALELAVQRLEHPDRMIQRITLPTELFIRDTVVSVPLRD